MSWSREQVQVLIEEYHRSPCLYATRTPQYKSRHARTAAMARIVAAVQKVRPGVTDAEIKCKFNGLRTNFMIEFRKWEASERSAQGQDEIYHPTVWYYKHMKFLLEHTLPKKDIIADSDWHGEPEVNVSDPLIELPIGEAGIKVEECTFEDFVQEMKTPATSECSTPCNVQSSTHPMILKRKRFDDPVLLNDFPEVTKTISSTIHEHNAQNLSMPRPIPLKSNEDLFGEYVASKMKLISNPDIHLAVEEEVTQVLFRGLRKCRET